MHVNHEAKVCSSHTSTTLCHVTDAVQAFLEGKWFGPPELSQLVVASMKLQLYQSSDVLMLSLKRLGGFPKDPGGHHGGQHLDGVPCPGVAHL